MRQQITSFKPPPSGGGGGCSTARGCVVGARQSFSGSFFSSFSANAPHYDDPPPGIALSPSAVVSARGAPLIIQSACLLVERPRGAERHQHRPRLRAQNGSEGAGFLIFLQLC